MDAPPTTTLYLLCGKIAAGKSTLARRLAARPATLLISQDHWMSGMYPGEIRTIGDFVRLSARLRTVMAPHVVDILRQGLSVVLDFPANTVSDRSWMRSLITQAGIAHELHVLDCPDAICKGDCGSATRRVIIPIRWTRRRTICSPVLSWSRHPTRASTSSFTNRDCNSESAAGFCWSDNSQRIPGVRRWRHMGYRRRSVRMRVRADV